MIRNPLSRAVRAAILAATVGLAPAALAPQAAATGLVGARVLAKGPAVTGVVVHRSEAGARLVFDLNMPVEASAHVLADPDRVIVDLPETAFLIDPAAGRAPARPKAGEGLMRSFRFGQFAPGRSRVVIDLGGPAKIVRAAAVRTESGGAARLVVEIAPTDSDSFRAAARAARAAQLQTATPAPAKTAPAAAAPGDLPVVVLDPGHGGVDMGAAGGKDALEKTIVLDFAKQVAAKLEKGGRVRPALTRRDDTFIQLGDRVKIARQANAALFVSIHADTLNEPYVHGATVYTLSDRASDAEAARVAAKENGADRASGLPETEEVVDVNDILFDLTRRETRAMSHVFANGLVSQWKSAGDLNKNPVRSAGFVVLKAPEVPSVLLELGYLSSDQDLAKLTSPEWREKAAGAVAAAIERYIETRPPGSPSATLDRRAAVAAPATR